MTTWLVMEGMRGIKDAREVHLVLMADGERGDFNVIDAATEEAAAEKFLDDTDAEACLVFPLDGGEAYLRQLKAVRP